MAEYLPVYKPGQAITLEASADITGGQLVEVSDSGTVKAAAAKSAKVVGVAAFDAANGAKVTIYRGGVQHAVASGAVTAGDEVEAAADGAVSTLNEGVSVGLALTTAADGADVRFLQK